MLSHKLKKKILQNKQFHAKYVKMFQAKMISNEYKAALLFVKANQDLIQANSSIQVLHCQSKT